MNPTQLFKCLADETRLKMLMLITKEEELCVCELTAALDEIQPKISRHLAQLRKFNLLVDRKQKQWVFYRLNPQLPLWIKQIIIQSTNENDDFINPGLMRLHTMGTRPERTQNCCN